MIQRILAALCLMAMLTACGAPTVTTTGQRAIATPVPVPDLPEANVSGELLNAAFAALLRPTTDLTESVRAVAPFPEIDGTEDAVIVAAELFSGLEISTDEEAKQLVTVEYETAMDHRGALDHNWTQLDEFGIPQLGPRTQENSSGTVTVFPADGDFSQITAEIYTRETGRTGVLLTALSSDVADDVVARFANWHDDALPLSPETDLAYVELIARRDQDGSLLPFYRSAWEAFGTDQEMSDAFEAAFDDQEWDYITDGSWYVVGRDFSESPSG